MIGEYIIDVCWGYVVFVKLLGVLVDLIRIMFDMFNKVVLVFLKIYVEYSGRMDIIVMGMFISV